MWNLRLETFGLVQWIDEGMNLDLTGQDQIAILVLNMMVEKFDKDYNYNQDWCGRCHW